MQGAPRAGLIPRGFWQALTKEMCGARRQQSDPGGALLREAGAVCLRVRVCIHAPVGPSISGLAAAAGKTQSLQGPRASVPSPLFATSFFKPMNSRGEPQSEDALWLPGVSNVLQVTLLC